MADQQIKTRYYDAMMPSFGEQDDQQNALNLKSDKKIFVIGLINVEQGVSRNYLRDQELLCSLGRQFLADYILRHQRIRNH